MNYFADVNIGLSRSMPLAMAHDIGMELQDQLETMDDIERAFVYLDYEYTHMPAFEHNKI
jgi:divalent metal cation (Fe/Co/Zn/Cd) transporter